MTGIELRNAMEWHRLKVNELAFLCNVDVATVVRWRRDGAPGSVELAFDLMATGEAAQNAIRDKLRARLTAIKAQDEADADEISARCY